MGRAEIVYFFSYIKNNTYKTCSIVDINMVIKTESDLKSIV